MCIYEMPKSRWGLFQWQVYEARVCRRVAKQHPISLHHVKEGGIGVGGRGWIVITNAFNQMDVCICSYLLLMAKLLFYCLIYIFFFLTTWKDVRFIIPVIMSSYIIFSFSNNMIIIFMYESLKIILRECIFYLMYLLLS